jgi:membrane-associated phospholipid phosphatase
MALPRIAALLLLPVGAAALEPLAATPPDLATPLRPQATWPGTGGPAASPALRLDTTRAAVLGGGTLFLLGAQALTQGTAGQEACGWCQPPALDRRLRDALRWPDPASAARASDALQVLLPAASALALGLWAGRDGGPRQVAEDLAVVGEAALLAAFTTQAVKLSVARLRPFAWAGGAAGDGTAARSFWSGHTSFAFSVAGAATQVARLRHRPHWRWLAAATLAAAVATGWLRVAGDRHWTTDVLAGGAAGAAIGLTVPLVLLGEPAPPPAGAGG